ncbi:unnamed protein product [Acanthoscelides obtectus]|uniref:Uncharacterized protein n=1 Tax=Acanthoscelides obtectus TaxID=200917 RepID=A0A9P0Q362_ACAOB|nr:unnamed protein product [Acanthoscelides obtectus]CAK1631283.1 hypothetical protein AOBTE_LOCUS6855 [Acanthoscelides obtectus]
MELVRCEYHSVGWTAWGNISGGTGAIMTYQDLPVKELLPPSASSKNKNVLSYDNIEFEEDAGSVQENFNNFYAKADKIPKVAPTFQELPQLSDGLSSFNTISIDQLRKRVMEFKNKSTADDICNVKFLKTAFCVLGYPLRHLINASLTTGKVPKAIKASVIVPIPKVSTPNKPSQYRPINLLSVIDKILETVVGCFNFINGQLPNSSEKANGHGD